MYTVDILAIKKFQFQKDRVEQARCGFVSRYSNDIFAADTVAMQVCKFQGVRDEQARCGFKSCSLMRM